MDLKQREERRMEAVRRLRTGEHAAVIAADLGVGANAVYMWGKAAREGGGLRALKGKPRSGRTPKLTGEQRATLKRMVLRGPAACGFERELWTLPMVGEFIQREFGVEYHVDHLSKLMRTLGLTRQKPAVRARERDERAIGRFIREEFPAIEKKRDNAAPR